MVWNVVRSGDEIREDMDGELTGNENGLALYWQFEEGEGTTTGDKTNGGNDGTLVNMTTDAWSEDGYPVTVHGIWNPVHRYPKAGEYEVGLKVQAGTGKWSTLATAEVEVIPGKVAGYVRAADLRTPVRYVQLILTSSHVDRDALARAAANDDSLHTTNEGGLWTETDANGYYAFSHLPLGSYQIRATTGEGDSAHEFEKTVQPTELMLNAPNQLAIDFVDLSVFPVGGQVVYSIKKGKGVKATDVRVDGVKVKAQPVGSTSAIEALPSTKSLSTTNTNYSLPLFAGKYLFIAEKEGHYVRIKETTPSYDPDTGLVTIDGAKTDIDFIDQTTRKLTVLIEDSGGNPVATYPDSYDDLGGAPIKVTVSGLNGQVSEQPVDGDGKLEVELNPGEYTITVTKADPEETDVDLRGGDDTATMTIPIPIELEFVIPEGETTYKPRLFDVPQEFLDEFGITDNPEGYMYYYPPEPRVHTYTIKATANGHSVQEFTLYITDDVSMETEDPAEEVEELVYSDKVKYTIIGGYPNKEGEDEDGYPLAGPKPVKFKATKEGYQDSDTLQDDVIVLGEVPEGTAPKVVSIPIVNYTVLHDPSGDGSYAYLDDSMTIKGLVTGLQLKLNDVEIPVYPSPWSTERKIKNFDFPKTDDDEGDFKDMKNKGLLGYRNSDQALGHFTYAAAIEAGTGAGIVALGPLGYALQLGKVAVKAAAITPVTVSTGIVQYEVSPIRHLETPSGDELPDLLGPGKGDIYFGEGWTLGLQTKYRMGIEWDGQQWNPATETVETYDILDRTNQYIYTIRDIENLIDDLNDTINDPETTDEDEKNKLKNARGRWQKLLNWNLAYKWQQEYVSEDGQYHGDSLDDFIDRSNLEDDHDKGKYELLIISGGPTFEYSRAISASQGVSFGTDISLESGSEMGHEYETSAGVKLFGSGSTINITLGSTAALGSSTSYGAEWESGRASEQTVGFVLNDDEIGDSIATRVYADPRWGTPLFFTEPGSITSDPWEPGTNKGIDITLELVEEPTGPFDYSDGAHYKVKMEYTGMRSLDAFRFDFSLFTLPPANPNQAYVEFNGYWGPFGIGLDSELKSAIVDVLITPPKSDLENSGDKQYSVDIMVEEDGDQQIGRTLTLKPKFADLRAPRAVITAPYDGERISPVFFPKNTPFKIEVVSEDTDLAKIQLQIRSKQPDGVWEPWYSLSGMVWEDGGANENVMVVNRLDRRPPRREFTFQWSDDKIRQRGVGEYALHAVATDKAFRNQYDEDGNVTGTTPTPNTDLDPPGVVFLVDDAKPSVLNSIPDYQARESERIYRGELSVTFTDDMRATDFSDETFYVTDLLDNDTKVAGYVSYSPALRKTVFVPIVPFQPNGFYHVEIKTDVDTNSDGVIDEQGVHDLAGNSLDNMFMWTFRTTDAPFEPTWSMNWRVTDGIDTDANNITSVEYGGLDDEDEKDVRAVPSLASQMRMSFLNRDKIEFDRDIRPADGRLAHHWFFVVDNVQQGSTVTLEYQPSVKLTKTTRQYQVIRLVEFDQDGNVSNTIDLDPAQATTDLTGEISFVQAYQYTTNQGERSRYFRLDVQKASYVAYEFEAGTSGWKFFSVPITPLRAEPFVNLGDDIDPFQLFQYDTTLSGYKVYPYDIGEVGLQTGHGYFTRLEKGVKVDVGGASNYNDMTVELDAAGWHAIGNPFIKEVDVAMLEVDDGSGNWLSFDAAVNAGWVEGTLYRWDIVTESEAYQSENPVSDSYKPATRDDQLNSWDGYWLKTNQAGLKIKIPTPPNLPNNPPTPDYLKPPMAPVANVEQAVSLPAEQFNLKLTLTSRFASDLTTTLGTHQNAQTGWDVFDQSEPPTLSKTVAAYFNHSDWGDESGLYNRDYRPALKVGEQRTWKFTVYTDNQDAEMTLSWEKAIEEVPGDIMLYFRQDDGRTGWQDMREVQSVNLISHSRITEISFEVRAERFEMSQLSDVQVVAGEKQVTIKWAANDNTFIDGYVIERTGQEGETSRFELPPTHSLTHLPTHEFLDTAVAEEATYTYQVTVHFLSGAELHSDPFTVTVLPVIKKTVLLQSYPNPFNPETWIPYELETEATVKIEIYNAAGQLVRTLDLGMQSRGRYISKSKAARWDGRTEVGERVASGLYFYVLKAGDFVAMKKMVILK